MGMTIVSLWIPQRVVVSLSELGAKSIRIVLKLLVVRQPGMVTT
jgi:hypothetical protein